MDALTEALRTAHSPNADEAVRAYALRYLEEFKHSDNSGDWAFNTLRTPDSPGEARHFALQCLASLLQSRWKAWNEEVRRQFRVAVMEVVASTGAGRNEEVYLRERIALLVSKIGEEEYPVRWPELLRELADIWEGAGAGSPAPPIIALMALKNLAEDCVDSDFNNLLPTARRTEILRALNLELGVLLPRLYSLMARTYEGRTQQMGGNGGEGGGATEVLRAALQTLKRFVVWTPPDLLMLQPSMNFLDVFACLMAEPATRLEALECVRDLGGRRFENMEHVKAYAEKLEGATRALIPQSEAWQCLVFGETLCHTWSLFVNANLEKWVGEDTAVTTVGTGEFRLLARCLEVMAELLRLPSYRASVALMGGWAVAVKQEKLKGLGLVEPWLPLVMTAYCEKSVKLCYDEAAGAFPENPVADEEFIDQEEYLALLSTLKANAMTLVRTVAELYPSQAVVFLKERLSSLLQRFGTPEAVAGVSAGAGTGVGTAGVGSTGGVGGAGGGAGGGITVQSEAYRQFEGLANPLDRILGGIPEPQQGKEEDVALLQSVSWLLSMLLGWQVTDPLLLYCQCLLLEGFKRFYRYLDQQLWAVLELLFQHMEYRDPALVGKTFSSPTQLMKHLSPEAIQVRRRGSNTLTEICNTVPDIVVPYLGELCTRCRALLLKGEVSDAQRPMVVEMLVVVANALGDSQQRMTFIAELVSDSEAYWESPTTSMSLSSVPAFLELFGVRPGAQGGSEIPKSSADWDKAYDQTHALLGVLNTFLGVTRRLKVPQQDDISSKDPALAEIARVLICDPLSLEELAQINPFVPVWVRILPNLLALLRVLHGMWAPDVRRGLLAHPDLRHLLSLNDDEVLARVKAGGTRPPQQNVAPGGNQCRKWPTWLNQVRQSAYQLLEKACHHKVIYYHPETLLAMRETVLGPLVWMEHRHVPWLIKNFLEPYIVHCPGPLFATHLPPIVGPFFSHMLVRCSVTWGGAGGGELEHLREGGTLVLAEDAVSVEDYETILDKLRREVTRAYVEALQAALALRGGMIQALVESNKAVHHQQQTAKAAHAWAGKTNGGGGEGGEGGAEGSMYMKNRAGGGGALGSGADGGQDVPFPSSSSSSSSSLLAGPGGGGGSGGGEGSIGNVGPGGRRAVSPPCTAVKDFVQALTRFLVVESDVCAVPLFLSVMGALCWQDQHSCRRAVHVGQRMMEVGGKEAKLHSAFGRELFRELVTAVLAEQAWVLGMQNDLVALACEIYRTLVIGENGTGGGGEERPTSASAASALLPSPASTGSAGKLSRVPPRRTAQVVCDLPRQVLLGLPGLTPEMVGEMEAKMLRTHQSKEQREILKETLWMVTGANKGGGEARKAKKEGKKGGKGKDDGGEDGGRNRSGSVEMNELQARLIRRGQALQAEREEVDLCAASVANLFGE